jgi:hypothetical protein
MTYANTWLSMTGKEKIMYNCFYDIFIFIVFSLFMQIIDSDMPKVDKSFYQRTDTDIYVYRKKKQVSKKSCLSTSMSPKIICHLTTIKFWEKYFDYSMIILEKIYRWIFIVFLIVADDWLTE